jgi:PadR family transcriptional regulator, regulatory protein PadR
MLTEGQVQSPRRTRIKLVIAPKGLTQCHSSRLDGRGVNSCRARLISESNLPNLLTIYTVQHTLYETQIIRMGGFVLMNEDLFDSLRLELRRGCLIIAVMGQLRSEHYGYALRKALADRGMVIDENTLYPLLRRLETQGLLASEWREEDKRKKRFYRRSDEGKLILKRLLEEWHDINSSLDRILEED